MGHQTSGRASFFCLLLNSQIWFWKWFGVSFNLELINWERKFFPPNNWPAYFVFFVFSSWFDWTQIVLWRLRMLRNWAFLRPVSFPSFFGKLTVNLITIVRRCVTSKIFYPLIFSESTSHEKQKGQPIKRKIRANKFKFVYLLN